MERRKFIRNASLGLTGLAFVHQGLGQAINAKSRKLTILHTNDTHSNIDPLPDNHPKYPGMGGVAKRHALIKKIRSEEQHVLLFDAGDIFQGTPYCSKKTILDRSHLSYKQRSSTLRSTLILCEDSVVQKIHLIP